MKIKLIEPLGVDESVINGLAKGLLEKGHEFEYFDTKTTEIEELKSRSKDADVLVIANNPLPNEVVESMDQLKMLSVAFTGIDHVGQDACRAKNVTISNAAGYSNESVAELTIGLTINVLRNIAKGDTATRHGKTIAGLIGNEVNGKVVGVVGTGRIGRRVIEIFKVFNCKVLGFDPYPSDEVREMGVEYVSIEELMSQSDIVTLHLPLMETTKGFISKEKIALMQPSSILINCARGPIVDSVALADALNSGTIAGAGLDVFDMEPPIPSDYPLLSAKNTVLTPHVAYASDESMVRRAEITFDNIYAWLEGSPKNIMKY